MKKHLVFLLIISFIACKPSKKEVIEVAKETTAMVDKITYPKALQDVFEAHGGVAAWKTQRTMSYVIPKPNPETHTIDLQNRNERIDTPKHSIGFDGKAWVLNGEEAYKGNPEFYHNLMFYFYAMPFVVADSGIVYSDTDDLVFEGKNYPGVRISYNDGVGISPKDEYYIHFDADTHQMQWLGYTVTYRSGEKSDNVKWIRYDDWTTHNGLVLPNSISWYKVEEGKITSLRNKVPFENITLSPTAKGADFYAKPEAGEYFTKPESK